MGVSWRRERGSKIFHTQEGGRVQGWESVCWGMLGIPLPENRNFLGISVFRGFVSLFKTISKFPHFHPTSMILRIFPQPGLPWGSNSQEERSVSIRRAGGSPVTLRRFPHRIWELGSPQRCAQFVSKVAKKCVGDLSCQKCFGGPSSPQSVVKKCPWRSQVVFRMQKSRYKRS